MAVKRHLGYARFLDDAIDAGGADPLLIKQIVRRQQDALAGGQGVEIGGHHFLLGYFRVIVDNSVYMR